MLCPRDYQRAKRTIVIGHNVRVGTVAIAHGGINVKVTTHREIEIPIAERNDVAPIPSNDDTAADTIQIRTERASKCPKTTLSLWSSSPGLRLRNSSLL